MKLLRLRSEDSSLTFKGDLDTNIVLPPNSKIGLKNVSFNKSQNEIKLEVGNNTVTFGINNVTYTAVLPTYTQQAILYNEKNLEFFLQQMENYMNATLALSNGYVIGGGWRISDLDPINKVELSFAQNPKVNIVQTKMGGYDSVGVDDASHTDVKKDPSAAAGPTGAVGVKQTGSENYEVFASQFRTLSNGDKVAGNFGGCGFVRAQIKTIGGSASDTGFFIGLTPNKLSSFATSGVYDFGISRFQYAIHAQNTTQVYQYMDNDNSGTPKLGGIIPAVDDVLEIALSEGVMIINVYKNGGAKHEIFRGLNDRDNNILYPYLVFYDTNCSVASFEFTPLNKSPAITELEQHTLQSYNGSVNPPIQELFIRDFDIDWTGFQPWQKDLGFLNLTETNESKTVTFTSDQDYNFVDNTECYLVLIDNFEIQSYDLAPKKDIKISGGQKSILAVIQNVRNKTDDNVLFEESNSIFIDLANANPIMFKNLNITIVTDTYLRPVSNGFGNMAILLD